MSFVPWPVEEDSALYFWDGKDQVHARMKTEPATLAASASRRKPENHSRRMVVVKLKNRPLYAPFRYAPWLFTVTALVAVATPSTSNPPGTVREP